MNSRHDALYTLRNANLYIHLLVQ